jgi:hypothetical protein
MRKKNPKKHPDTADIKIVPLRLDGFVCTSSINPFLKFWGSTRHRALSAYENGIRDYLKWERELDERIGRDRVGAA